MKRVVFLIILVLTTTVFSGDISAVDLPYGIEDCLIAFEETWSIHGGKPIYTSWGTGFFYQDVNTLHSYIVTNRHILVNRDSLCIKINEIDKIKCGRILVILKADTSWFALPNPDIDLAVIPLNNNKYIRNQDSISLQNTRIMDSERVKPFKQLKIGDEAYFLGFPSIGLGLDSDTCNYPVLRRGVISLLTNNELKGECFDDSLKTWRSFIFATKNQILIDATSIGGNSGSPVLTPPDKEGNKAKLIGVIEGHVTKLENQAGRCKQTENLDLAVAVPAEHLLELTKFVDEKRKELNK